MKWKEKLEKLEMWRILELEEMKKNLEQYKDLQF